MSVDLTTTHPPGANGRGAPIAWAPICPVDALVPDRGVAALVDGHQVAVFLLADLGDGTPGALHAVDHHDPLSGANVLARGLVGSTGEVVFVASPLHKERWDLRTGRCLDADAAIAVHRVRARDGVVEVALDPAAAAPSS